MKLQIALVLALLVLVAGGVGVLLWRESNGGPVVYERSGGFAGTYERLEIVEKGEATITSEAAGETEEHQVNCSEEIEDFLEALEQASLGDRNEYRFGPPSDVEVPDAFQHVLVYGDVRIRGTGGYGPDWWTAILRDANSIIEMC